MMTGAYPLEGHDIKLTHPSRIVLIGPSAVGKSTLCLKIIRQRNVLFDLTFDLIVYVYSHWQQEFDEFLIDPHILFITNIELINDIIVGDEKRNYMLFLDDQLLTFSTPEGTRFITGEYSCF
jgi:hypothetical protein